VDLAPCGLDGLHLQLRAPTAHYPLFDVKNPLSPEEPTFTAQATTNLGPLKLSYSTSWGRSLSSKLGFDMELKPKESWVEVQFTTDSLKGILVRQGQTSSRRGSSSGSLLGGPGAASPTGGQPR
jgi:hypothetical protein